MVARQLRWVALALFGVLAWAVWPTWNVRAQVVDRIHLPVVYRGHLPSGAITGRLLNLGGAEVGTVIELVKYSVPCCTELATFTATTSLSGTFSFETPMGLRTNERYYLRYNNPTQFGPPNAYDTTRVLSWTSFDLTAYTYNEVAAFPDIDVGNVSLNPNPDVVPVPFQFGWGRRAPYPTESYDLLLTDQGPNFFGTGPLGYVDHYDLASLPGGFAYDTPYIWGVHIASPTAGEGYSFFFGVIFGSGGPASLSAPVAVPAGIALR